MDTPDYAPLDMSQYGNAGPAVLPSPSSPALGQQQFHGLPFQIGAADGSGQPFLVLGGEVRAPCRMAVGRQARHLIFAHRLLDSHLLQGGPVGELIAEYVICYADGGEDRLAIRERLEIAVVPSEWGQWPFLALADLTDRLLPRYQGRWGQAGERQTEAVKGNARDYYLWPWANPRPECLIDAIIIVPAGPRFLLAAITVSSLEEEPFPRTGLQAVRIVLPQPGDAQRPFNLAAEVDRGVATYPYALPSDPATAFLQDPMGGWGEQANRSNSPAYVEIAASPSATVTISAGEETLGNVRWGALQEQGVLEPTPRLRVELIDRGRNWVRTTVVDDATGQPIPCRVHFRSPEGVPFAPHGHHAHVNSNNGTCSSPRSGATRTRTSS